MKFVTAKDDKEVFVGLVNGSASKVLPLRRAEFKQSAEMTVPETMIECIELGEDFIEKTKSIAAWVQSNQLEDELSIPLNQVTLLAPIPRPKKNVFCVGKNYAEHAIELGSKDDIPEHVMVFTKAPTAVTGPNVIVPHHRDVTSELDYEGELAVIIGKKGKGISRENALEHVFGYTILNDITARDLQSRHQQFFLGKSLDSSCPIGPWIVHTSALKNPNQLNIQTRVNADLRQNSNTENFIFPIEEVISVMSRGMTLEAGDIIATGTPAGVGKGFKPPRFLKPGDEVEITIEGIGTLYNQIHR